MGRLERLRRALAIHNATFTDTMRELTRAEMDEAIARVRSSDTPPIKAWRSKDFLASLYVFEEKDRLTVCRAALNDVGGYEDGITWDELMRVKAQCGYGSRWAVEIYPPDDQVVNVSNMRHLWLLEAAPAFGWRANLNAERFSTTELT